MQCPRCGTEIPSGSDFCLKCGKKIKIKEPRKVSVKVLVTAIVITAVLAVGASILINERRKDAALEQGASPAATSPALSDKSNPIPIADATLVASQPPPELSSEDLFKLASPSVVLIEVFKQSGERRGTASGFIANSEGAVVTNYHVIRGASSASIRLQDGSTTDAQGIFGYDPHRDVAVLKANNIGAKALRIGDSEKVQIGDRVVAIGSPLALQNTISDGMVSGIRNEVIQTSTPISPGSSGGPLFNRHGEVIGIAVAGMRVGQNLNFAVPINWVKNYLHSSQVTSFADVLKENTIEQQLVSSTISVPARQSRMWPITIDPNTMSNAELDGSFSSSGGVGGNIRVLVLNQSAVIYNSGRTTKGTVHLPLGSGSYRFVIDNSGSTMFAREVTAEFKLRYVK
jgi:S1-C subfamily serine protease